MTFFLICGAGTGGIPRLQQRKGDVEPRSRREEMGEPGQRKLNGELLGREINLPSFCWKLVIVKQFSDMLHTLTVYRVIH
jgi:hypothetical protein